MPCDALSKQFPLDPSAARARLERHVAFLAFDKGIAVTVVIASDGPALNDGPHVRRIELRNGTDETFVQVDHDTLTGSDQVFCTLVLPKLDEAIIRLAGE